MRLIYVNVYARLPQGFGVNFNHADVFILAHLVGMQNAPTLNPMDIFNGHLCQWVHVATQVQ